VRTAQGHVKDARGNAIAGADVAVTSSAGDEVFHTKAGLDGLFQLAVSPGKYRVEIEANAYVRLIYVVDLRFAVNAEPIALVLQRYSECHDIRTASVQKADKGRCSSELLPANLTLHTATLISGQVRDETGAPFKNSDIVLKKLSDSALQPTYVYTKTDDDGAFTLDEAEPGKYRLLASPTRAFAQPAKLDCYEKRDCNLEITLKANASDLAYAGCPVR
jgi:hypothetical protein